MEICLSGLRCTPAKSVGPKKPHWFESNNFRHIREQCDVEECDN